MFLFYDMRKPTILMRLCVIESSICTHLLCWFCYVMLHNMQFTQCLVDKKPINQYMGLHITVKIEGHITVTMVSLQLERHQQMASSW